MDTSFTARLRRLDTGTADTALPFDYDGLMERQASRTARAQRRLHVARATAGALVVALVGASVWRLGAADVRPEVVINEGGESAAAAPRIVRADTYLPLVALEDHIARVDDALSEARVGGDAGAVARLERTRAELMNSYTHVRYAEMLSANL